MRVQILAKDGYKVVDLNRRQAIRERCLNCSDWIPSEVAECPFNHCPLYLLRMGKGSQSPKQRNEAIRRYCLWCMAGQRSEVKRCVSAHYCPLYLFRSSRVKNLFLQSKKRTGKHFWRQSPPDKG
jgi:Zn-finger protein